MTKELEQSSSGAAELTVSHGDEERCEKSGDRDRDGGDSCGLPEPSVEGFKVRVVDRGRGDGENGDDDEEKGGELMKKGGNCDRLDWEFAEPLLEKAMWAKWMAVELFPGCPRNEKCSSGEEEEPPRVLPREAVFCPADEEGLRKKVA